jgi:hypothetical protein
MFIVNSYQFGGVAPPVISYFTDLYGVPIAAYSLRKLSPIAVYSGPAIRVRRSSDNTELDINFITSDANAVIDTAALLSFVGANNGFLTVDYDQSGNANHKTQTSASNQLQIVTSGALEVDTNGHPVAISTSTRRMDAPDIATLENTQHLTIIMRGNISSFATRSTIASKWTHSTKDIWAFSTVGSAPTNEMRFFIATSLSDQGFNRIQTTNFTIALDTWYQFGAVYDGTLTGNTNRAKVYKNGILTTSTSAGTIPSILQQSDNNVRIGDFAGTLQGQGFVGAYNEVILYDSSLSATEMADIYSDQDLFYN